MRCAGGTSRGDFRHSYGSVVHWLVSQPGPAVFNMMKILLFFLMLFATGCGPQFYLPANQGKPAQIVVSAYTQNGCLEELQGEAKNRGVEVKLTNVETNFRSAPNPWELLFLPFYKGYKCTGEVTGPAKSTP